MGIVKSRERVYDMIRGRLNSMTAAYSPFWGTERIPPSSVYHYLKFGAFDVHIETDCGDEFCTISVFDHNRIYLNHSSNVWKVLDKLEGRLEVRPGPIPREDFIAHGFKDIGFGQYRIDGDYFYYVVSWEDPPYIYRVDEVRDHTTYPKEVYSYSETLEQASDIKSLKAAIMKLII